jgi:hypothetical protein
MAKSVNNKNNTSKWVKPVMVVAGVVIFIVLLVVLVMVFRPKDTPTPTITPTVTPTEADTVTGKWHGTYSVASPAGCSGDSGTWDATLVKTGGTISGSYSSDVGLGGTISGTTSGSDVTWNIAGGGGVTFTGSINNNVMSGNFTGVICSNRYNTHTKGTFTGSKS